jgi:hypothetical protein
MRFGSCFRAKVFELRRVARRKRYGKAVQSEKPGE